MVDEAAIYSATAGSKNYWLFSIGQCRLRISKFLVHFLDLICLSESFCLGLGRCDAISASQNVVEHDRRSTSELSAAGCTESTSYRMLLSLFLRKVDENAAVE